MPKKINIPKEITDMMNDGENNILTEKTTDTVRQKVLVTASGESWVKQYWRPLMAWQYMAVCMFDFIIAPIMVVLYYSYSGQTYVQWVPLTLQGGGLYHLAMGAVLGITSWSRGQEKIKELSGGS